MPGHIVSLEVYESPFQGKILLTFDFDQDRKIFGLALLPRLERLEKLKIDAGW